MAYQVQNFQPDTWQQGNPFLTGFSQGQDIVNNYLKQQQQSLENQKSKAELPYAGELAKQTTAYKEAMAKYLSNPNQSLKYMTTLGKSYVEPNIVQAILNQYGVKSNQPVQAFSVDASQDQGAAQPQPQPQNINQPQQISNNYSNPESSQQPSVSDSYSTYRQKISTDPTIRRNAQQAQLLMNQVNDIDTKPMEKFSGVEGRGKAFWNKIKMGTGVGEVDPDYRAYQTYIKNNKTLIGDQVRKTLATSVVPDYVMRTIMPLADPTSTIWSDPEQVRMSIQSLKDWANSYASEQTEAMTQGVAPTVDEAKSRYQESKKNNVSNAGVNSLAKGLQLPSFSSKSDFQAWYNKQPPMVQDAVKKSMGG